MIHLSTYLLNDPKEDDNAMDVDDEDDENDKQDDKEQDDESDPLSKIVSQHQIGTTRICIVEDVMDDEGTSLFNHRKNQQVKQSG